MKRDWVTDLGIAVVGIAAAILTFTTLRDLALACGITGELWKLKLAYLVPVTVDAAGIIATRVWLRGTDRPEAVRFARWLAWSCIAGSVVGNAGQHGMAAYHLIVPWWVVVLVSAVPPAMLGAVVHLGHLRTGVDRSADRSTEEPVQAVIERTDSVPTETPELPEATEAPEPARPAGVDRTDADLLADIRRIADRIGERPTARRIRTELKVGPTRANRLLDQLDRTNLRRTA